MLIDNGRPGTPRVIWKTEAIANSPAWIKRALHNNIKHDRNVNTFTATDNVPTAPVNTGPIAVNDSTKVSCGGPVTINVLGNDTDADGDTLLITSFTQPENGVVTRGENGQLIYTSNGNSCGLDDKFSYTISDGNGGTDTATVTISVDPAVNIDNEVNAANDSATTDQGQAITIDVLANDDADAEIERIVTGPSDGSASIVNGLIVYTPNTDFTGTDKFVYEVRDPNGNIATATVTVIVNAPEIENTAPTAVDDFATTTVGQAVTLDSVFNDSDPEGDILVISSVDDPANGTAVISGDQIIYTPDAGFVGTDSFTYTISDGNGGTATATEKVTVTDVPGPVNNAPNAVNDSTKVECGNPVVIDVLGNDTDSDGDALSVASFSQPANGTVTRGANGQLIYTSNGNSCGIDDKFTYTISDGNGGTDTATVTVSVDPMGDDNINAANDSATTDQGQAVTIDVLSNDDADATIKRIKSAPSNGSASVVNGQIIYTPDAAFSGTDTFTYEVRDPNGNLAMAMVTVTVNEPKNTAPVAVNDSATTLEGQEVTLNTLSNDSDPESDTLTITDVQDPANGTAVISGGQIIYTPDAGFTGTETFTYTISDGNGGTATATETVTVTPRPNLPPVAKDDSASTGCSAITINVLDNDSDPDGDALSIVGVSGASLGVVVVSGNTIVYTPSNTCSKGNTGTDNFSYTISDGNGNTDSAYVSVDVNGVTDGGNTNAEPDDVMTTMDQTVTINVLANDAGKGLKVVDVDMPKNGTAMIVGSTVKYTPAPGFTGTDSFWYDIVDSNGYTDSALILVYVEKACTAGMKCN